ncbi:unnamed protein product [Cyprideis torosa]|uniref:Dynactin subunit 1 n=1 Tax=Cyprideis torosa TaxID=163714 RepID=A0A7R8W7E3_9CRUS|nr:unnamed protein product [Cyprideis torosa]CAG0887486.1 unnamed protein product [Cyprideis torosa]
MLNLEGDGEYKTMDSRFKIGNKVRVIDRGLTGLVSFIGATEFAEGVWIGVILDEPLGKNNGSVKGKTYFEVANVRHSNAKIRFCPRIGEADSNVQKRRKQKIFSGESGSSSIESLPQADEKKKSPPGVVQSTSRIARGGMKVTPTSKSMTAIAGAGTGLKQPSVRAKVSPPAPSSSESPPDPVPHLSPAAVASAVNEENENLKREIKDLTERVEMLTAKRTTDREKLKELEKLRLQNDQLLEFKARILESQAALQRDLTKAKEEAKEAIEAKERISNEATEHAEMLELVTLDKEVASEKLEAVTEELEQAKERIEELTLDLEMVKEELGGAAEMETGTDGARKGLVSRHLEEQNERLKETLVRVRDLAAQDKYELQKVHKEVEEQRQRIRGLEEEKERFEADISKLKESIRDLQEQVDASLGAEEMVELLTEKNLKLEEKAAEFEEVVADLEKINEMNEELMENARETEVDASLGAEEMVELLTEKNLKLEEKAAEFEEVVADLEKINEMNEELMENARETELELREEVDLTLSQLHQEQRESQAAREAVADRERTIGKFRELVSQLNEQNEGLREALEKANTEVSEANRRRPAEKLDFEIKFEESKAQQRAIDLELRFLELEQMKNHVSHLQSFLPDAFMSRGGDHDAILTHLCLPRFMAKCGILASQLPTLFPPLDESMTSSLVLKSHKVDRAAFGARFGQIVARIQALCVQMNHAIRLGSPDLFGVAASIYMDLSVQERLLDFYLDLLRKNQLDENVPLENLEKCNAALDSIHRRAFIANKDLTKPIPLNHEAWVTDMARSLISACDVFAVEGSRVRCFLKSETTSEMEVFLKSVLPQAEEAKGVMKKVRRPLPQDTFGLGALQLDAECLREVTLAGKEAAVAAKVFREWARCVQEQIVSSGDASTLLGSEKVKELLAFAVDTVIAGQQHLTMESGQEEDESLIPQFAEDPLKIVPGILDRIMAVGKKIHTGISEGNFYKPEEGSVAGGSGGVKEPSPMEVRYTSFKAELRDAEGFRARLLLRDEDVKELRRLMKLKQEELGEMTLRRDMLEKKLDTLAKEKDLEVERIQRKTEDLQTLLHRKEKEFRESLDQFQRDIDTLEGERADNFLFEFRYRSSPQPRLPLFLYHSFSFPTSQQLRRQPVSLGSSKASLGGAPSSSPLGSGVLSHSGSSGAFRAAAEGGLDGSALGMLRAENSALGLAVRSLMTQVNALQQDELGELVSQLEPSWRTMFTEAEEAKVRNQRKLHLWEKLLEAETKLVSHKMSTISSVIPSSPCASRKHFLRGRILYQDQLQVLHKNYEKALQEWTEFNSSISKGRSRAGRESADNGDAFHEEYVFVLSVTSVWVIPVGDSSKRHLVARMSLPQTCAKEAMAEDIPVLLSLQDLNDIHQAIGGLVMG